MYIDPLMFKFNLFFKKQRLDSLLIFPGFCGVLKDLTSFLLVEFRPGKGEGLRQPVIGLHDNLSLTKGLALGLLLR